jgi:hypothetical protein
VLLASDNSAWERSGGAHRQASISATPPSRHHRLISTAEPLFSAPAPELSPIFGDDRAGQAAAVMG